jgi:hypothetical protein
MRSSSTIWAVSIQVGVYPLLEDDTCHFLAIDFDEAEWREDARAFVQSCDELGVPVALEISRSGKGAHAWVFFAGRISARDARRLGTAIISHTCSRTRQLKLESYDRLFPNQDTMPKGGFGNLIALPLQKAPRESSSCSVAQFGTRQQNLPVLRTTWRWYRIRYMHESTCRPTREFRMCSGTLPTIRPARPQFPTKSNTPSAKAARCWC